MNARLGYLSYFVHTRLGFFLFVLIPGFALIGIESHNIFNIIQDKPCQKNKRSFIRKISDYEDDIDESSLKMVVCPKLQRSILLRKNKRCQKNKMCSLRKYGEDKCLREIGAKDVVSRSMGFEEFAKKVEEILT